jgi:hypothetical protein
MSLVRDYTRLGRERETVHVNGTGLHTSREIMLWRCGGGGGGDAGKVVRSRRKGA